MTIWNQIKHLFAKYKKRTNPVNDSMKAGAVLTMNEQNLVDLMHRLEKTMDGAYSCEETYALLDEYVEMVADNEEAKRLMPLVQNHLDICSDCRDEFDLLLHVLRTADS